MPTETVHGLAADGTNGEAVARIFEVKGRPRFNPLIAHVADSTMAKRFAVFGAQAQSLADAFWPGPLTLVLPLHDPTAIHPLATAGLATVAVRVPHGPLRELLARLDRPLVAPSANRSGQVSPTQTEHVLGDLAPYLDATRDVILADEGHAPPYGIESTIVSLAGNEPVLLRPGALSRDDIERKLEHRLSRPDDAIIAPGMLASHYAPDGSVRLNAETPEPDEFFIAFGPANRFEVQLSERRDMNEAARNLFSALHSANVAKAHRIAVAPIPNEGLGEAINDRLRRAAAPR